MSRYINPLPQYFDDEGNVLSGGKLYFYESGTSTLQDTYSDSALTVPNTNPVILDADGRLPDDVYLSGAYKVRLTDATDTLIREIDPVGSSADGLSGFSDWSNSSTYDTNDIVQRAGKLYQSIVPTNIDNDPETSSSDWRQIRFIQVTEGDYTAGFTLTLDQVRIQLASEAEVLAGVVDDKAVAPDTLQAKFDTLADVATSGAYSDLSGTPTLATVATTGSYDDLTDKPSIPTDDLNVDNRTTGVTMTSANDIYIYSGVAGSAGFAISPNITINKPIVVINNTDSTTFTVSLTSTATTLNGVSASSGASCTVNNRGSAVIMRIATNTFIINGDITDVS